ncbi:hypothetical protein [Dokdonella soli]|uniref:hypothetical protein n=1 Tax=Dokdonella soli TaxID=529810 RepID=UPI0031D875CF
MRADNRAIHQRAAFIAAKFTTIVDFVVAARAEVCRHVRVRFLAHSPAFVAVRYLLAGASA